MLDLLVVRAIFVLVLAVSAYALAPFERFGLSRWIAGYRALNADAAADILRLISRDLDRGAFNHPADRRRVSAAE